MKWLQDNPLGQALAGINGIFVLFAAIMAAVWTLPVVVDTAGETTRESNDGSAALVARQAGTLSDFQVINDRPVFSESRLPVIAQADADEAMEDAPDEVQDAPDVKLTGIIITPSLRIASLMPADRSLERVMAQEGEPLTGAFVGWQVAVVQPRNVILESRDGQRVNLELEVHDAKIKAPPKPAKVAEAGSDAGAKAGGVEEPPLSRAEQIRLRIAERRDELRREQEGRTGQTQGQSQANNPDKREAKVQDYQSAIRALMGNKRKEQARHESNDG